ncbi:uncharacterized protein ACIB01_013744 [Guaruba guarouba]
MGPWVLYLQCWGDSVGSEPVFGTTVESEEAPRPFAWSLTPSQLQSPMASSAGESLEPGFNVNYFKPLFEEAAGAQLQSNNFTMPLSPATGEKNTSSAEVHGAALLCPGCKEDKKDPHLPSGLSLQLIDLVSLISVKISQASQAGEVGHRAPCIPGLCGEVALSLS